MVINKTTKLINSQLIKSAEDLYISVPAKLPAAVKHLNPEKMKMIHSDRAVAEELCLYFCSFLRDTYLDEETESVGLLSTILSKVLGHEYLRIIEALMSGTHETGSIIECDDHWEQGEKPKHYWFADSYKPRRCGNHLVSYKLKTLSVQNRFINNLYRMMSEGSENIIINNLHHVYPYVGLPSKNQLIEKAKKLVSEKKTSKKGKLYMFCNGNQKRFSEEKLKTVSFIEDGFTNLNHLAKRGFMSPRCQGENAGNRVSDTFNGLNSWIREEVTINGRRVAECDYKCFHPNIAISVYGGRTRNLTHKRVAEYCEIDTENEATMRKFKTDHLAFFNKEVYQMKWSMVIREFYQTHEPEMLNLIESEKKEKGDHTVTSAKLFAKEVEIMTKCISKLNAQGIFVLYVFDALLCDPLHKPMVEQVMNETALECGVYTATYDVNAVLDEISSEAVEPAKDNEEHSRTTPVESAPDTQDARLRVRNDPIPDSLLGLSA